MITPYVDAVSRALSAAIELLSKIAIPIAICLGLVVLAAALIVAFRREDVWFQHIDMRDCAHSIFGYVAAGLLALAAWAILQTVQPLAEEDMRWRERTEATLNPVPDAPPVMQYGPTAAALSQHTYTRTLTLPPDFLKRVGEQGVGILAPYLTDPSASDVLSLIDTFRQSGQDVVFTREMTRMAEEPIPFSVSRIHVKFKRMAGRAFDAGFEGTYVFENPRPEPVNARFLFVLPPSNTLRDLSVKIDNQAVVEPNPSGQYEWKGEIGPGAKHEAVVKYRVVGARTWSYDFGSQRRRVQQFRLDAETDGAVKFLRGSLKPTSMSQGSLHWDLANVVTAQQVAISLPPDVEGKEAYLQALNTLPVSLLVFLIGVVAVSVYFRVGLGPGTLAGSILLYAIGLGAAAILSHYVGYLIGFLVGPLAGAVLAAKALGKPHLLSTVPAALLPAAFLSPFHSGLLVLVIAVGTLLTVRPVMSAGRKSARTW